MYRMIAGRNLILMWVAMAMLWSAGPGFASVIYVDCDATGNDDGSDWTDAYVDLQDALGAASSGDEIWVAEGTYLPTSGSDRTVSFELPNGVKVYGGFDATETQLSQRDWENNETILSGDLDGDDISSYEDGFVCFSGDGTAYITGCASFDTDTDNDVDEYDLNIDDNSYHVVYNSNGSSSDTRLDGFTVSGGFGQGDDSWDTPEESWGAGILIYSSEAIIENCTVTQNLVYGIRRGTDIDNEGNGAGICTYDSTVSIQNCTIEKNLTNGRKTWGGGVCVAGESDVTIDECTIANNQAIGSLLWSGNYNARGGGVAVGPYNGDTDLSASCTMTDCTISGNKVRAADGSNGSLMGGGVLCHSDAPELTMINCTVTDNEANASGCGICSSSATFTKLTSCVITGNTGGANGTGGGISIRGVDSGGTSQIENCLIANNSISSATYGGGGIGVWGNNGTEPTIINCTIVDNTAPNASGGGIYARYGDATVKNCIVWGNDASSDDSIDENIYTVTVSYSDVEGGYTGTGNINDDPDFVDDTNDDYHLTYSSPCIDTADNSAVSAGVTTDLDGNPRFVDGDSDETVVVDMGAYEYQAPNVTNAVSVKTHGTVGDFEIDVLDRTDNQDIECRKDGVTKLVVTFDMDVQGVGGLDTTDVSLSSGSVTSVTLSASDELTIEMSGTTNGIPLTVTFPGIAYVDIASAVCVDSVCIRQLVGDVRADKSINAADRIDVRNQMGQTVTSSNFRCDVRADGAINVADRIDVRNAMGTGFTGSCDEMDMQEQMSEELDSGGTATYTLDSSGNSEITIDPGDSFTVNIGISYEADAVAGFDVGLTASTDDVFAMTARTVHLSDFDPSKADGVVLDEDNMWLLGTPTADQNLGGVNSSDEWSDNPLACLTITIDTDSDGPNAIGSGDYTLSLAGPSMAGFNVVEGDPDYGFATVGDIPTLTVHVSP